jgi:23S rRNA (adenine2503-C2)-methyltransferase
MRNITLSTCGIVPKIYDLMNEELPITLTISLHAPNDEIRSRTMPVNDNGALTSC